MADFGIGALQQAASQAQATNADSIAKLKQNSSDFAKVGADFISSILSGTDSNGDTALSLQARKLGELDAQQKEQEFRGAVGDSGDAQYRISSILANNWQQATIKAQQQQQEIAKKEQVQFLDDPLQWLMNYITLPDEKNALQGNLDTANQAATSIQNLNSMMSAKAQVENQYAQKLTQASIDSQVAGMQANLQAKADQAKMAVIENQSQLLTTVMSATEQQVNNIAKVIQARESEAHLALAESQFAMEKQKFGIWLKDYKDTQDQQAQLTDWYNKGAAISGMPTLNTNRIKMAMQLGGDAAKKIQAVVELGFRNASSGTQNFGPNPAVAANATHTIGVNTPAPVADIYARARSQMQQDPSFANAKKDPAALDSLFNKYVGKIVADRQSRPNYNDPTDPYAPASTKIMAQNPALASTPLFKNVIIPNGIDTSDPQKLAELGLAAVKAGKISAGDFATGMAYYYNNATQASTANNQLVKYGLPAAKAPVAIIKSSNSSSFSWGAGNPFMDTSSETKLNTGDPTAWANYAVRSLSAGRNK